MPPFPQRACPAYPLFLYHRVSDPAQGFSVRFSGEKFCSDFGCNIFSPLIEGIFLWPETIGGGAFFLDPCPLPSSSTTSLRGGGGG